MDAALEQITAQAQTLTPTQQQQVLNFMRSVHAEMTLGIPGKAWIQFDGLWAPEEAEEMLRASQEC